MRNRRYVVVVALLASTTLLRAETTPCHKLNHLTIPATSISLPTTGATITSAHHHGTFCKVLGRIHPIDPAANDIRFELNLPDIWNGKALHYGGGTFDGYLAAANGLNHTALSDRSQPTPLGRGYATFGSDSGHHKTYFPLPDAINAVNARFARNPEMQRNFAGDQLKKVHDVAVSLITTRYGHAPTRMYFIGGSTGGREALRVAQRYPADYDGVLAAYAAWNQVELDLQFMRTAQALYSPGGFLGAAQTRYILRSVMSACDATDGLRDHIISNPSACHVAPAALACSPEHHPHGCLKPAQLHTLETFATPQRTTEPLSHDVDSIPGYNALSGMDLGHAVGLLPFAMRNPVFLFNSFGYVIGDDVTRNFLSVGPHFDSRTFDTATGGQWHDELLHQAHEIDSTDTDLRPFFSHGGKLILIHGTVDAVIPTNSTVDYYQRLQAKLGPEAATASARLYLVPGLGHGVGRFDAGFDTIGTLDAWADRNIAPTNIIVTDNNLFHHHRTRPLCDWPTFPQFFQTENQNKRDRNTADHFRCVTP